MTKSIKRLLLVICSVVLFFNLIGCNYLKEQHDEMVEKYTPKIITDLYKENPVYQNEEFVVVNGNSPVFTDEELKPECKIIFSELDSLNRCGPAFAVLGKETMPTDKRQNISNIRPTGWHSIKYNIISGGYLYNRCHLIGYQLSGVNANVKNLITGTQYLNVQGMLQFENMVADCINETGNHVAYRVTPIFLNENLLASGVQIEAYSIEDNGKDICFNVYCFNVQPEIEINYKTGESRLYDNNSYISQTQTDADYILDSNSMIYHTTGCSIISTIENKYKLNFIGSEEELNELEYTSCEKCKK